MDGEFRVPKRDVRAQALVVGAPRMQVRLFLGQRVTTHTGYERPSDLLNGPAAFVPAVDEAGAGCLLRRDAVLAVSVPVEEEVGEDHPLAAAPDAPHVTRMEVELVFENGEQLRGTLAFVQPEARRRLGDFLNDTEPFFPVREGQTVHVVNKARITRARVIGR